MSGTPFVGALAQASDGSFHISLKNVGTPTEEV